MQVGLVAPISQIERQVFAVPGESGHIRRHFAYEVGDEPGWDRPLPGLGDACAGNLVGRRLAEVRGEQAQRALFSRDLHKAELLHLAIRACRAADCAQHRQDGVTGNTEWHLC